MVMTRDGAPTGDGYYKASINLMMAVDGMELCGEFKPQVLMLVTADPDFGHLALSLRKRVFVLSLLQSSRMSAAISRVRSIM